MIEFVREAVAILEEFKTKTNVKLDNNIDNALLYTDYNSNLKLIDNNSNKLTISLKDPINWEIANKLLKDLLKYFNNLLYIIQSQSSSLLLRNWLNKFNDTVEYFVRLLNSIIEYNYREIMNYNEIIHKLTNEKIPSSELQALKILLRDHYILLVDTKSEIDQEVDKDDCDKDNFKEMISLAEKLPSIYLQLIENLKEEQDHENTLALSTKLTDQWNEVVYLLDEAEDEEFDDAVREFKESYNEIFKSNTLSLGINFDKLSL